MSSGGGPVSAASGGVASANVASSRRRGDSNYRNRFGGCNMSTRHRIASTNSCRSTQIPEAA